VSERPAAFLDRDGTIIRDANYLRDPTDVDLLSGAAAAIRRLNDAGVAVIVVTNQSGIARGLLTQVDYEAVRARLDELLATEGARITASYMCPHHPDATGPCDCRKPGLAMYKQAIKAHGLDAKRSAFIGDRWRDVAASSALGGLPILIEAPSTPREDLNRARDEGISIVKDLGTAVDQFLLTLPA